MLPWKRIFTIHATCLVITLLVASCSKSTPAVQPAADASHDNPAAALVKRFNMGAGLESMANQVARTITTFGLIAKEHGTSEAVQVVKGEIPKSLPAYQSRWDNNLASIHSKHFSADELRSLAVQGTSSPCIAKFRSTQETVATEIRADSSPLLQQLVTKAPGNAVKHQQLHVQQFIRADAASRRGLIQMLGASSINQPWSADSCISTSRRC